MKVRDSGMPDEAMWARFFDARGILTALDFSTTRNDVAAVPALVARMGRDVDAALRPAELRH